MGHGFIFYPRKVETGNATTIQFTITGASVRMLTSQFKFRNLYAVALKNGNECGKFAER